MLVLATFGASCAPQLAELGREMHIPAIEKGEGGDIAADRYVTRDGLKLGLMHWDANTPQAVIVALHGMSDYSNAFAMPAPYWAARGITTYAYDQRSFGRSPQSGIWAGSEVMRRDLVDFVDVVRTRHPGLPVFVLGESMGGAVAILGGTAGQSLGADAIILISPALLGWSKLGMAERSLLWTMMQISPGSQVSGQGLNRQPTDNIPLLEAFSRDPYVIKRTRIDAVHGLVDLMEEAWQRAPDVKLPTLIVYAGDDQVVPTKPIEDLTQRMSTVRSVCYLDGFHMLLRDVKGARAWQEILDYVTSPADRAPGVARACARPG
jgi:alpha-beta hydrolase superfamily lysophospholipase